jgi:hypothetical protein
MAIDATVGGASANSYLTVAAADLLAASELGRDMKAWVAATVDEKEAALLRATEEVDAEVGRVAYPATTTQALLFPRRDDYVQATGIYYVPGRLQRATILQAAFLLRNADLLDDAVSFRARGLQNFSNPDGTSGQLADDASFGRMHPRAQALLTSFAAEGAVIATIIPT